MCVKVQPEKPVEGRPIDICGVVVPDVSTVWTAHTSICSSSSTNTRCRSHFRYITSPANIVVQHSVNNKTIMNFLLLFYLILLFQKQLCMSMTWILHISRIVVRKLFYPMRKEEEKSYVLDSTIEKEESL